MRKIKDIFHSLRAAGTNDRDCSLATSNDCPLISVIVVVYRMSRQVENTLYTLSLRYQRDVGSKDYEVIVVENHSDDLLGEEKVLSMGDNFHYFLRNEAGSSPAGALNFGYSKSRGPMLCLIIDGARMVTPRIIKYALYARMITRHALVVVPGYHLGFKEQHYSPLDGYDERAEQELLEKIDWKKNGYRLFEVSYLFKGAHQKGFFTPMMESNCLFCPREHFERIGKADERFDLPGGGMINLDTYRRLALIPESVLFVLPGEGSFHQYHGGVTTSELEERKKLVEAFKKQYEEIRGEPYRFVSREPIMLGAVTGWSQGMIRESSEMAIKRFESLRDSGQKEWSDDMD